MGVHCWVPGKGVARAALKLDWHQFGHEQFRIFITYPILFFPRELVMGERGKQHTTAENLQIMGECIVGGGGREWQGQH